MNGLLFHTENAQPCIGIVFTCIKFQSCIELIKDISDNLLFCFEIYDILRWITQYFADVCDRMTANLRAASAYYITGFLCCLVCNIHYMQNRGWKSELLVVSVLNANHNVNHISLIEKRNLSWHQRHLFRDLYKIQFDLQIKDANLLFGLLKTGFIVYIDWLHCVASDIMVNIWYP